MENMNLEEILDDLDSTQNSYQETLNFILNNYAQEEWDDMSEKLIFSEKELNDLIIRKEDLGEKNGLNFLILIYNNEFSEDFLDQEYIKDLLDIPEYEYHEIMGRYNSLECGSTLWGNLFYNNQWVFSENFLLKNIDRIKNIYGFQRYQTVTEKMFQKIIDDIEYINLFDQKLSANFIQKYFKDHHSKFNFRDFNKVIDFTEEQFIEFISYKDILDKKEYDKLWYSVGYFNISEEFIKSNLDKINTIYKVDYSEGNSWKSILNNKINYSNKLIEDNIQNIDISQLFNGKVNLSKKLIEQYYPKNNKEFKDSNFLEIKNISEMNELVKKMISEEIIDFKSLSRGKYVSLELIEKYHNRLDMEYVLHYNNFVTIDFFVNKILEWYPNLKISISTYLNIENANENNLNFILNKPEFYSQFTLSDMYLYFNIIKDIMLSFPDMYSDNIKKSIDEFKHQQPQFFTVKNETKDISSFEDPAFLIKFIFNNLCDRIEN